MKYNGVIAALVFTATVYVLIFGFVYLAQQHVDTIVIEEVTE